MENYLVYLLFPQYYPCIEIGIKQNRNVNADCRVHGLYITGFRPNPMYTEILAVSYIFFTTYIFQSYITIKTYKLKSNILF